MFDGDGAETMEMQAHTVVNNLLNYNGSQPCPSCGVIMSPVQYMYSSGICPSCHEQRMTTRIQRKLA